MRAMRLAVIAVLLSPGAVQADPPKQPRLDAHGFPLPDGAIARLGDLRFAQPGPITALAVSPDDKMIATAGDAVYLWDAATGRIVGRLPANVRALPYDSHVCALHFSQNGQLLAVGGKKGEIELFDVCSGSMRWSNLKQGETANCEVVAFRFLDAGRTLVVAYEAYGECRVDLWDVANGTITKSWQVDDAKEEQLARFGRDLKFCSVALSPSGRQMAWLMAVDEFSRDENPINVVFLHDTLSGKLLRRVTGNSRPWKVQLLDEGKTLLRQARAETPRENAVIDISSGRELCRFAYRLKYGDIVLSRFLTPRTRFLAVSKDGKSVFMEDDLGTMKWQLDTCKQTGEWRTECTAIVPISTGNQTIVARGARLSFSVAEPKPLTSEVEHAFPPWLRYAADGRLNTSHWREGLLCCWDPKSGTRVSKAWRMPTPDTGLTPRSYDASGSRFAYHTGFDFLLGKNARFHVISDESMSKLETQSFR